MLVRIGIDLGWFMVIIVFMLAVLGYAFMLLQADVDEYADVSTSLFTAWKLYMLGDFEGETYSVSALCLYLFYGTTLIFNVLILNAVIALMGDSWENL